jgi:hypothetical protein
MEDVLRALNRLVAGGVIEQYAIGGAIGASAYLAAINTEDVDAFVFFPAWQSGLLNIAPIYAALRAMGGIVDHEHIRFGDWLLQILPDANPLVSEAIREAAKIDFEGIPTRFFTAEYLCAIALQTARAKDILRVRLFLEGDKVDQGKLSALAERFGLLDKLNAVQS